SPGWITSMPLVIALVISRCGSSVTLADDWAVMMLVKLPKVGAKVKATVVVFVSGVGSPAWMGRVTVNVNDAPGARLPPPAAMAAASRSPSNVSVKKLLGLLVSSTRLGLSDELVLVTVKVYVMG